MKKFFVMLLVSALPLIASAQQKETVEVIMLKIIEKSSKNEGGYTMPAKVEGKIYITNNYIILSEGGVNKRFNILSAASEVSPEKATVEMATSENGTGLYYTVRFERVGSTVGIYFIHGRQSTYYKVDINLSGPSENNGEKIRYNKTKRLLLI